jgi:hypothetical protein
MLLCVNGYLSATVAIENTEESLVLIEIKLGNVRIFL